MEEIDIWRSAARLLKQHGLDAERHMQETIARGDPQGEAVWERILRAIKALRSVRPQDTLLQ